MIPEHMMPACPLMCGAWVAALQAAVGNAEIVAQFERDTGVRYTPPRSGIEALVDDATGNTERVCLAFIEWFNTNLWGDLNLRAGEQEAQA